MKTEAVSYAAYHHLAQEDDILAHLLHGDMIVLHAVIYAFQIVKLMIMSSEQCLRAVSPLVDVLHDRAGDRHTVICGSTSSDLVKKHQRSRRYIVQDHRSLEHLHHEGRLSAGNIVRSTYAGEELVTISDRCLCSRNEGSHLSHQDNKGGLSQKGRLTGHIRTCKDYDLLSLIVKEDVIRHEFLSHLHHCLDHRMTALPDVDDLAVIHLRTAILIAECKVSKTAQHVESGNDAAVLLDHCYIGLDLTDQFCIYLSLKGIYSFFSTEDLLLVFLEFFGDVALRIDKSLLSDPLLRH